MRRPPSYRLHKATGQAVVHLNGRDIYLGRYDTAESREQYYRLIAEWEAAGRKLVCLATSANGTISVAELCLAYWEHAQQYYRKPNGEQTDSIHRVQQAIRGIRQLYGTRPVDEFGPKALELVRQKWIARKLSRKTINDYTSQIKSMFKYGVRRELVPETVHRALLTVPNLRPGRSNAKETAKKKPVPEAHIAAVLPHVASPVPALIELQILTAARGGELVIMRPMDLDTTGDVWCCMPESHKTQHHGHDRAIWLGPKAQAVIRPFLGRDLTAFMFTPAEAVKERRSGTKSPRRPNQKPNPRKTERVLGNHYTSTSYRIAVERACRKTKTPLWTPHRLRHNAGTSIKKQYGAEAAKLVLGLATGDLVDVYAECDHARAREIIMKIG